MESLIMETQVASKPKTVITIEMHQLMIVRPLNQPIKIWCKECNAEVEMTTPEQVAILLCTTPREIYRRIENGTLHFIETDEGEVFICFHTKKEMED